MRTKKRLEVWHYLKTPGGSPSFVIFLPGAPLKDRGSDGYPRYQVLTWTEDVGFRIQVAHLPKTDREKEMWERL